MINGKLFVDNFAGGRADTKLENRRRAEQYEECYKDCGECEAYDKENHYCPKFCNVIAEAVKEIEENNNGWISCSERFPEIDGNTSDTVLVCGSNGFRYMAFWCDDLQWRFCECGMAKEPVLWTEIVAWQPLPLPYQPKGE